MIWLLLISCAVTIACAIGWRRTLARERHWRGECDRQINLGAAQYERLCKAQDDLKTAAANADRLASSVREYVKQMDEFAMKLGEQPCALSREREALSRHQKLKESQPCPPSPS